MSSGKSGHNASPAVPSPSRSTRSDLLSGDTGFLRSVADLLYAELEQRGVASGSEERGSPLLEAAQRMPAMIWYCDRDNRIGFANATTLQWFAADAAGRDVADVLPADLYVRLAPYLDRAKGREPVETELSLAGPDGLSRRVRVWLQPVRCAEAGFFAFAVDVSERMRLEQQLQATAVQREADLEEQAEQMRRVLDAVADAALTVDADGSVRGANPAAERLFGMSLARMQHRNYTTLLPKFTGVSIETLFERSRARRGLDADACDADGRRIPIHVTISVSADPRRAQFILAVRDFTAIRAAQQRSLASERLAAIGETMTALAHESRNALQRIQSCLTLLQLRTESPETQELIDDMQDAQDQLQRLYEEVNNFAAPMPLSPEPVDLGAVLERTWQELELTWQAKSLQFLCADRTRGTLVSVDRARISQVFRNLFENAIDASGPGGQIRAQVTREQRSDAQPVVAVAINDAGSGMPADVMEHVFDLLFTTKRGGTGMGLAIARRIVHEHDGAIELHSTPGRGTTATVRLPLDGNARAEQDDES